ncbi:alpha/beta hydrolase fold domain-containing protein [Aegicerativicinus sediminis]|uniref:alpha/beta hydrolase fold domain-containing protein n=1 Tax=Aegicerativicinus sediminis TaxID=2893202 RepID=UPI001E4B774B|nr:alpha/beta hydrolase fold domain-containing protein [Aegicerativicinus sediminis]
MFGPKLFTCFLVISFFVNTQSVAQQSKDKQNEGEFKIVNCSHSGVSADYSKPLSITFNQPVDKSSLNEIIVTSGGSSRQPIGGNFQILRGIWIVSQDAKIITFRPSKDFVGGMLISITLTEKFRSLEGNHFKNGKDIISFITDNGNEFGIDTITIDTLKIEDGNVIPLIISLPKNANKIPVLIFVHGGGWTGGTATQSFAALPTGHASTYLTNKLGVTVVGVAYRCKGSNGNFTKAKQDVEDAIQFIKTNAKKYNLDTSRMGLSGESAGAPLSALIAQEDPDIKYYIGINGIYDFENNNIGQFGPGNDFGQQIPSTTANSAISHIRPNPPTTMLIHGNKDITISHIQSEKFNQAVISVGGQSEIRIYDGQPHWEFYMPGGKYEISTLYQIKEFLIKVMGLDVD